MFEDVYFLLNASKTCFGVAVVFFILAGVLFFLFDIKNVLMIETGSSRRKTIQEMKERNLRTGKLRMEAGTSSEGGSTREQKSKTQGAGKLGENRGRKPASNNTEAVSAGRLSRKNSTQKFEETQAVSDSGSVRQNSMGTAFLNENTQKSRLKFTIIQKMIVIHTDEVIPA